jgi:hypothetical protein
MDVVEIKLKDKSISELKAILDIYGERMNNRFLSEATRVESHERYSKVYEILNEKLELIFNN